MLKTKTREKRLDKSQLSMLLDMTSPAEVHGEVIAILDLIDRGFDRKVVHDLFNFTENLYYGRHPQYRACNTDYHNFRHITDTYLAMARLIHGAVLKGEVFSEREIIIGLGAALLHDSGLIQHKDDNSAASGAEYVKEHVQLSMDFVESHASDLGFSPTEVEDARAMILCTDLAVDFSTIKFSRPSVGLLGKLLATADLMGQMADRIYLEKLLFLFHEFREANIGQYEDEIDFLHQTLDFYKLCDHRFEEVLDRTYRFMAPHFKERWNIDSNLYVDSLNNQRRYLTNVLKDQDNSPYHYLKRAGIVKEVRRKFGKLGLRDE